MFVRIRGFLAAITLLGAPSVYAADLSGLLLHTDQQLQASLGTAASAQRDAALARLQPQLDALRAQLQQLGGSDPNSRKIAHLLAFGEQVLRNPEFAAPGELPTPVSLRLDAKAGSRCEDAVALQTGDARRTPIAAGASLWFRVDMPAPHGLRLSTRGSEIDAAIAVWADCREQARVPRAQGDDSFGLQADVAVAKGRQQFWLVRVENRSARSGDVVLSAVRAAVIEGTVVRESNSQPLLDVAVSAFNLDSGSPQYAGTAYTDNTGHYSIGFTGSINIALRTGSFSELGYNVLYEAFDNRTCPNPYPYEISQCGSSTDHYTVISLADPATRTVDFRLENAPVIAGRILSSVAAAPVVNASIQVFNPSGSIIAQDWTDQQGRYRISGLAPQSVFVTAAAAYHTTEVYDNIPCLSFCNFSGATALVLAAEQTTRADFELLRQPVVKVEVTINGDAPSPQTYFTASLLNSNGEAVAMGYGTAGSIRVGPTAPGTYRLRVRSDITYPALYSGVECESDCIAELALATPVQVLPNTGDTLISMDLRRYPQLLGRISSDLTNSPIGGARLNLVKPGIGIVQEAQTDSAGNYLFASVAPGNYLLEASATGWTDELYDNIPCERPNPTLQCKGGTFLNFNRTSPDRTVDIQLSRAASITGTIRDHRGNSSYISVDFFLLSPAGVIEYGIYTYTDANGRYTLTDIPSGTYVLAARTYGATPQLYAGVNCPSAEAGSYAGCNLAGAQSLVMGATSAYTNVDFAFRPLGARPIRVVSAESGLPLAGVSLDLWLNESNRVQTQVTDTSGFAELAPPFGSATANYFISTDNGRGLIDEVYDNKACPNGSVFFGQCSLAGGSAVVLPATGPLTPIVITLADPDVLLRQGFEDAP